MSREYSEIMNIRIPAGSRMLYLDLKQNVDGTRFLSISEVRFPDAEHRSRILIDEQYVADLHRALGAVLELTCAKQATKAYTVDEMQKSNARTYKLWTSEEETALRMDYSQGHGVTELSKQLGRAPTAIISRLYQIGVLKANERPRWESRSGAQSKWH